MAQYLLRRLLIAIPTLLLISLVVYMILALAPGDPLSGFATNPEVPPEARAQIRAQMGLDRPSSVRYVTWLWGFLHGGWGYSFASRVPVLWLISSCIYTTLLAI